MQHSVVPPAPRGGNEKLTWCARPALLQVQQLQEKLARKGTAVAQLQQQLGAAQAELERREQQVAQQLTDLNAAHAVAAQVGGHPAEAQQHTARQG